ncbi:peroxiredoxin [Sunxiuqinia elliptica]|uniref:Alkyl hydroperoxide reductase C n=1 Tax=Sunxiuqinia elliptica TaxID=655355 RepID=A0A1I2M0T0_9BACT|nr:peroxiredoxin [Sunxiuqinia elliptica]TDO02581.1 peroxiredoxin (alkyl hydroperoxide reductase subunit C) [Sunxiuqinia elliptica]TDO58681.1 peroxiredoxin (alkyl hydroperoxide reductase subunit C) [Sunxiuqinia elliptica]SFF85212.1 peroxiredoxin (alkyl hydroperoxide reductase subunit C) [Sunxiuqinia elliptica]
MLTIGQKFPEFKKTAVVSLEVGKEFETLSNEDLKGKWSVIFWWPKDFTFVCPTEITAFNDHYADFQKLDANLVGASTDSEFVHLAWRTHHVGLKKIQFPMLADTSKSLAEELGILEAEEKIAYRATFIIDPEGVTRWVSVNDLAIGRNVPEVLRVLEALKTGKLTPCDWEPGQATL